MARTVEVPEYEVHERVPLEPSGAALLVIDMQNDFVKEGGYPGRTGRRGDASPDRSSAHACAASRDEGRLQPGHARRRRPEWEIWGDHVRRGTWGWQIVEELAPREDQLVIQKGRYDAFYGTPLDHFLRLWGIDILVICGTVANICVHYTAASATHRAGTT